MQKIVFTIINFNKKKRSKEQNTEQIMCRTMHCLLKTDFKLKRLLPIVKLKKKNKYLFWFKL